MPGKKQRKNAAIQLCERIEKYGLDCYEEIPGKFKISYDGSRKKIRGELSYYGKGNWTLTIFEYKTISFNSVSTSLIAKHVKTYIFYASADF